MVDFLDEVRAEVRQQRIVNLFEKHRYHLLLLVIALLVATGITGWYQNHKITRQEAAGEKYSEAAEFISRGESVSALPRFNSIAEQGAEGWRSIAMLQRAAILVEQKNMEDALLTYEEVIADSGADVLFRDYAVVMSAWLMMRQENADAKKIEQRLLAMTGEGKPWRFTAMELLALFYIKQAEAAKAASLLTELKNSALAPSALQQRADDLLGTLPVETTSKE